MNKRQQFLDIMSFREGAGIFLWGMRIRKATIARWKTEGLPDNVDPLEYVGVDALLDFDIATGPVPWFTPKVLEETDEYKIWIDDLGATRKDFKNNREPGFVTRSWLAFPVAGRQDFLEMARRFDADSPFRYKHVTPDLVAAVRGSTVPVCGVGEGPFWTIRDWMGFEETCIAFIERPGLIREMAEFYADFIAKVIRKTYAQTAPDWFILSEDMAFKGRPMISPGMTRDFLGPVYRAVVDALCDAGVEHIFVDCDGDCTELIDVWLDAGITGIYPIEIAAGMDPVALRKRYAGVLGMVGGIDKRAIARGPEAIRAEVRPKVPFLASRGGYAPGVDHAAPPDISLDNYRTFVDEIRRVEAELF